MALLCVVVCTLAVLAQIGGFIHALEHVPLASRLAPAPGDASSGSQAGDCDLCLALAGLAQFLTSAPAVVTLPAPAVVVRPVEFLAIVPAIRVSFRSRAPPARRR